VGVSVGPGGFTGLRIAVSVAKMLAEVLEVSLVAIPSALVVAEAHAMATSGPGPILVVLAVKRGSFWSTRLRPGSGSDQGYHIEGEPALATAENLDLVGLQALIGDEHLPEEVRSRCREAGLPVIEPRFDPAAALRVTARSLAEGATVDSLHLLPLYARPPEAVTIWEQRRKDHPPVQ
jgi:tRNA A37 threonylcarbamoyladenosine modification protein TsaB